MNKGKTSGELEEDYEESKSDGHVVNRRNASPKRKKVHSEYSDSEDSDEEVAKKKKKDQYFLNEVGWLPMQYDGLASVKEGVKFFKEMANGFVQFMFKHFKDDKYPI